ncbi:pyruvate:ferredoxin (flavodoxin) oxidoreductase [Sporolactobacillus shoreicorticis]|uniref:Pyruvate:ferredoxin (Flavodoxin) oxidoreductase n=1 Tax=Sporolactobacillus shoreicorticis TaxID=1923877 RepID=A0ABW5S4K9_9BACL|nr:pyruvate:ferredoxin (flavodoxin) oxidoreductase [Sporolactobacillus shoreicorticis]MCO7124429.1 pyruvate:ferredoxin (flavodoxin) oxidoreductase [Sporolactobacillus shoreicorticis]
MIKVIDGNEAAAEMAYAFTEAAVIYPITPSSGMAEKTEQWSSSDARKNIFGHKVRVIEMQSEGGVAGTMHGLLKAGTLCTSYTSSQGLLLMAPTLYKMVGEQLPAVLHVAARSVSSSVLSIYGDHSDVMSVRQTGAVMLAASSVQEAALFSAAAHLSAVALSLPVVHFIDGFNTSHELRKIVVPEYDELQKTFNHDAYHLMKEHAMRNDAPRASGASVTPDLFFQQLETVNPKYQTAESVVANAIARLNPLFQTNCAPVDYYGAGDAEVVVISMGSVAQTVRQVVDEQNTLGKRFAMITIHLYRPFPKQLFLDCLPKTVRSLVVLDRTKEPGAVSEPLVSDVRNACYTLSSHPIIIGGRYGLGSKDVTPDQIRSAFFEGEKSAPKPCFTLGIIDDVTHLSLLGSGSKDLTGSDAFQMRTWGFGSDGAVSCNKQTAKIIGETTGRDVQGLFWYDPKKSGNLTISHLRFSKQPIYSAYHVQTPDAVVCYCERYIRKFDLLRGLKANGLFLVNSQTTEPELALLLTNEQKRYLARQNIRFYTIPANKIAEKYALGPHINTIMQICFFYLSSIIPFTQALKLLKEETQKKFAGIREEIVWQNARAMDEAVTRLKKIDIPEFWADLPQQTAIDQSINQRDYFHSIQNVMNQHKGDQITVGTLIDNGLTDGSFPAGTAAKDKRDLAIQIPIWNPDTCIGCNFCSMICPHASIRPFILKAGDADSAQLPTKAMKKSPEIRYRVQVSPLDCTGCSLCQDICPSKTKSLTMTPIAPIKDAEAKNWDFVLTHHELPKQSKNAAKTTIRDSQFQQPLLEFPGACAGCGQPAYIKLLTQLFGSRMMIANATGCTSIWGNTAPSVPYTTNENGFGPVWGTSLLENNAEYGFGIQQGSELEQQHIAYQVESIQKERKYSSALRKAAAQWLTAYREHTHHGAVVERLIAELVNEAGIYTELQTVLSMRHFFTKRSQWIIGGDGWAYDIDSSGIDHILAENSDVNILVLDNEGYSNTGGQRSKASPTGSRTRFSVTGNKKVKKDFASIVMTYENAYVAQICIGANPAHTLNVFKEAEAYNGPSILIAYSPCILHGITKNSSVIEEKKAVDCGYWVLFHRTPETKKAEAIMKIDSRPPQWNFFQDFLAGENRFSSAFTHDTAGYSHLLKQNEAEARKRYNRYRLLEQHSASLKEQEP